MGRIMAIANQKGGVGKTTTVINLSSNISAKGKKVLMVDIDPQGNTTSGIGINKEKLKKTIYDVLLNNEEIEDCIVKTKYDRLYILPANIELAGAEIELVSVEKRENRLKEVLSVVKDEYDYILIDCPPSLGLLTINALTAADSVLVPIQCEYYALEGLTQLMNTIKLVQKGLNKDLIIEGVVLTMFDGRTNLSIQVVDEVKKYFKNKVYRSIIPRNVRLGEAPSFGQPISVYDPKSKGAEAYEELAEEVIGRG
ncbi:MAG: AAA family ATPase [Thermoanaerobacteraceae bacterium]|nr:AAA family ATPase [Thermoanaerobacteraceae bacterium]